MKILEWNVNCANGSEKYGRKNLKSLFPQNPACDVLILTEFYRLHHYEEFEKTIKKWGYTTFITPQQENRNDVFIAVLNKHQPKLLPIPITSPEETPNFLAVSLTTGNQELTIAGVRFFGEYNDMYRQFINFLPPINNLENVIVGGDFNNGKIHGDEKTEYSERDIDSLYMYSKNGITSKYLHFDYNYHRIKYWLAQNKFSLITPAEGCSYRNHKIDHFAVKGIQMKNVEYIETELSDHNQLVGEMTT